MIRIIFIFFIIFRWGSFTESLDVKKNSWISDDNNVNKTNDIHCFCNLPQCVSTGYMCRTGRFGNESGCFSEINKPAEMIATRHGCIELLHIEHRQKYHCDNTLTKLKLAQNKYDTEFLLLCCHEDMCNHVDNPGNQKIKLEISESTGTDLSNSRNMQKMHHHTEIELHTDGSRITENIFLAPERSNNNDDWFRVATIAVPICGAVILFSLIAIAIKILRTDRSTSISLKLDNSKDINSKFTIDPEAQIIKNLSNLEQSYSNYVSNSNNNNDDSNQYSPGSICDKKNETRAKFNQLINIQYSLLPQQQTPNDNINLFSSYQDKMSNVIGCVPSSSSSSSLSSSTLNNCSKLFHKNVNNFSLGTTNNFKHKDKHDKIYNKDVFSPICENSNDCQNSHDDNDDNCNTQILNII